VTRDPRAPIGDWHGYGFDAGAFLDPAQHKSLFDTIRDHAAREMRAFASSIAIPEGVTVRLESDREPGTLKTMRPSRRPKARANFLHLVRQPVRAVRTAPRIFV
jgi:hypothetical protein